MLPARWLSPVQRVQMVLPRFSKIHHFLYFYVTLFSRVSFSFSFFFVFLRGIRFFRDRPIIRQCPIFYDTFSELFLLITATSKLNTAIQVTRSCHVLHECIKNSRFFLNHCKNGIDLIYIEIKTMTIMAGIVPIG